MFADDRGVKNWSYADLICCVVTLFLILISELLAVGSAIWRHELRPMNLNAPLSEFLPLFVLLPALVSIRSYRQLRRKFLGGDSTGEFFQAWRRSLLQIALFEYVVVVWALSLLSSALHRGLG